MYPPPFDHRGDPEGGLQSLQKATQDTLQFSGWYFSSPQVIGTEFFGGRVGRCSILWPVVKKVWSTPCCGVTAPRGWRQKPGSASTCFYSPQQLNLSYMAWVERGHVLKHKQTWECSRNFYFIHASFWNRQIIQTERREVWPWPETAFFCCFKNKRQTCF